jgi:ADP-ribose pyrophosphatase YjhB (NUDIX family)
MSFAVAVLCIAPEGIPLVRNPRKPTPHFWKLPGGKGKPGETPEEAAVRELEEETGIRVSMLDLGLVDQEDRGDHVIYVFRVEVPNLAGLLTRGDEGEEVKVFMPEEILGMKDFFLPHRDAVGQIIVESM